MNTFRLLTPFLSFIVPLAARWVRSQEAAILARGCKLTDDEIADAKGAGVQHPERIRVQLVPEIPMPVHPLLLRLGRWTGLVSSSTSGITLGYGIYIRQDCRADRALLVHELVHVGQSERLGSIAGFLRPYLKECLDPGYPLGHLEQEAIRRAQAIVPKRE